MVGAVPGQTQGGGAALFWSTPRGCDGVYSLPDRAGV